MKILVHFDFDDEQIDDMARMARSHGDHHLVRVKEEAEAVLEAADAEVLLGRFAPAVCAAAPKLRWIQSFSAGMDKFLFPEIIERDVVITNMAGMYAPQGGEHAWALLLALSRGIASSAVAHQERRWGGGACVELTGGTLGIVGLGGFGLETAKRAQGYDMTIIALDPVRTDPPDGVSEVSPPTSDNIISLLQRSDAVIIACPLTDETYHMIGDRQLAAMKKTAYLVCVSRGGIIDETALVRALEQGGLAGAGLDVVEQEPLPGESPLWSAPNLLLTPHRAGASQHRPRKTFEFFRANLDRYLRGEKLENIVDKKLGY
jgi:phosphoglycerate dehydrogenase-like enzyme